MTTLPVILLLSGSLRTGSTNEAVLRTAQAVAPSARVDTVRYEDLARLPHFNPDDDTDPLPAPVTQLRAAIERADGILICTPEYAGTLPGSFSRPVRRSPWTGAWSTRTVSSPIATYVDNSPTC